MRLTVVACLTLLLSGCESGLYNVVSENLVDPSPSAPQAGAFASKLGIPVQWTADANADRFVLYRRQLSLTLPPTLPVAVYQGTAHSFLDTSASAANDTLYAYSIAKIRGQQQFGQGPLVLGAFDANYVADFYGSNDTEGTATPFSTTTVSDHVFYYAGQNASGQLVTIDDHDWYYIDLGPNLQEFVYVIYGDINQDKYLIVSNGTDSEVVNNIEFSISNPQNQTKRVWFNLHYNTGKGTSVQTRIDYELHFKEITSN